MNPTKAVCLKECKEMTVQPFVGLSDMTTGADSPGASGLNDYHLPSLKPSPHLFSRPTTPWADRHGKSHPPYPTHPRCHRATCLPTTHHMSASHSGEKSQRKGGAPMKRCGNTILLWERPNILCQLKLASNSCCCLSHLAIARIALPT